MQAKWRKIVIGTLFLIVVAGSSVTIAFADQNIGGMLTSWFDQKTEESVEEIEQAILTEQQKQTKKLQEELRLAIEAAEEELHDFVEAEKSSRVEDIRKYADSLMEEIEIDESAMKETKLQELEQIFNNAKVEMDQVLETGGQEGGNEQEPDTEETEGETDHVTEAEQHEGETNE
ncbi:hypothetical protein ACDX78_17325 [Virgibacillus oceani]